MNAMKLLLILCTGEDTDAVRELIDKHHIHGFTEINGLRGSGDSGLHMGTRAFPGSASLIFTAVPAEQSVSLVGDLEELAERCMPGEGLKVFVLDAAEAV